MKDRDDDDLPMSRRPPVDEDVRREVEFHIDSRIEEMVRRGVPRDRAMEIARDSFGDRDAVEAECRTIEKERRTRATRTDRVAAAKQDLVIGWRLLRKTPGITMAAILTLALGIGANSAVFSIVNGVLLRPLPYPDGRRLVDVMEQHDGGRGNLPWANFLDFQAQNNSFEAMASYGSGVGTVIANGAALRVRQGSFSARLFDVLQVRPVRGRLTNVSEHARGATPVALVTNEFWRDVLGAPASLDGVHVKGSFDFAVVGVLPPGFAFDGSTQIWRPMELDDQSLSRTSHNWNVVARLKPGVSRAASQVELNEIVARLAKEHSPLFDGTGALVYSLQDKLYGSMRKPLYLLLAASGVVLLAACANLTSTQLARGAARSNEFAVRAALGAPRIRIIRQLLAENALLALLGTLAGLLLAVAALRVLASLAPATLPIGTVEIDRWVVAFTAIVGIVTTVLVGMFPAIRLSEAGTNLTLREGTRGTANAASMRAWNMLVAAEVALAVTLFTGSALLIKSFARVMDTELGFDPTSALAVTVSLPGVNYEALSPNVAPFHERALARLRELPGISSVGFANVLPLQGGNPSGGVTVEGKAPNEYGVTGYSIYRVVGGDYFDAAGIKVERGEVFRSGKSLPPLSVVVDRSFADQEWPGQDPIGRRVRVGGMDTPRGATEPWYTVTGVVSSVRAGSVIDGFAPTYYFDHRDRPPHRTRNVTYVVRSGDHAAGLGPAITRAIHSIDPDVAVETRRLDEVVSRSVAERRFTMTILATFAGVALLLAIAGIYGVISYSVAQRGREIGIRLALGATPASVRRMVIRSAGQAVVPGLAAGAVLSLAASRSLDSLLYDVSAFDVLTLGSAVGVLGTAALLSSALPALRATRVDPARTMRTE
jgi:putative ABC transport system permease protein